MKGHLLLILLSSLFSSIQPMDTDWSDFKNFPDEIKLSIFNNLLESQSIIGITNDLNTLKLVDIEFYNIVSQEKIYKTFFDFQKFINSENDIFKIFRFLKDNPRFLQYNDLAAYLHSVPQFSHFPEKAIKAGLESLVPEALPDAPGLVDKLFQAIDSGDREEILELLLAGAKPDAVRRRPDYNFSTPLMEAIEKKNYPLVKLLISSIAKIDKVLSPSGEGLNPLSAAILNQDLPVVKLLLEHGANPNEFIEDNKAGSDNPLALALVTESIPILQLLIAYGANPNIILSNGLSALLNAAYLKNKEIIYLLLKNGATMDPSVLKKEKEVIKNFLLHSESKKQLLKAYEFMVKTIKKFKKENPIKK